MRIWCHLSLSSFFYTDAPTTEIYTLSLHDALPICRRSWDREESAGRPAGTNPAPRRSARGAAWRSRGRSEEHTSELQSRQYLVCRLLLEKKNYPLKA